MSLRAERIAAIDLCRALLEAQRRQGWNFRATPIRKTTSGACTVFVVPAKVWAYWRRAPHLLALEASPMRLTINARCLRVSAHVGEMSGEG